MNTLILLAAIASHPPAESAMLYATVTPRNTSQVVTYQVTATVPVLVRVSTSAATVTRRHRAGQWRARVIVRGSGRVDVRVYGRASGQLLVATAYEADS